MHSGSSSEGGVLLWFYYVVTLRWGHNQGADFALISCCDDCCDFTTWLRYGEDTSKVPISRWYLADGHNGGQQEQIAWLISAWPLVFCHWVGEHLSKKPGELVPRCLATKCLLVVRPLVSGWVSRTIGTSLQKADGSWELLVKTGTDRKFTISVGGDHNLRKAYHVY